MCTFGSERDKTKIIFLGESKNKILHIYDPLNLDQVHGHICCFMGTFVTFVILSVTCLCLQVRVENLTKERDMLRQAESRLSREKEAMLAEQRNQNLLLTNLKTIQVPYYSSRVWRQDAIWTKIFSTIYILENLR